MSWLKTDNTDPVAKIMLRAYFLKQTSSPKVLDLFQGKKTMFENCYKSAEKYKGYDINAAEIQDRLDNRRAIGIEDLDGYNFFDLDAYGSPWELFFNIIIKLKTLKKASFVVTDGLFLNNRYGSATKLQKAILKIPNGMQIPCFHRHYIFFLSKLFSEVKRLTKFQVKEIKISVPTGRVKYLGFTLAR
ncbi:MAG: hypothetical protein PHG69_05705 [Candidatus Omnitrophica bacterium]|nr:hypothetical protein [Candidatus Omnitrophota bacterium]